jgi:small-conductance mechanosensitive channel
VDRALDLVADNDSAAGVATTSLAIVLVAVALRLLLTPLLRRRFRDDPYRRYWAGKILSYALTAVAVVALVAIWAPLGGRLSVILGFATAGVAFAMQEVIGAFFGWLNVLLGRIYTVGDRVEVGGVRGDVIDITPMRTTIMEIGSEPASGGSATWVAARQPTGRVVTVSNKKTFTDPVFNYSAHFDWIWEELTFTVPIESDWRAAEEAIRAVVTAHRPEVRQRGEEMLRRLGGRFLLGRTDVEPHTFVRPDESAVAITARFLTPVRGARASKDEIYRTAMDRLDALGIPPAYRTVSVVDGRAAAGTAGSDR